MRGLEVVSLETELTMGEVLGAELAGPHAGVPVSGVATDSRCVRPGEVFFARPGQRADGRAFIDQALARGAAAVVVPAGTTGVALPVPVIAVADLAGALGRAAAAVHGDASARLRLVGITGTNGKTTVAHLAAHAAARQAPCGYIGTLGAGLAGALGTTRHTTPEVTRTQKLLAGFERQGATQTMLEVSSHGIEQGRIEGLRLDTAVFTNLTRDHLDYHGDMRHYAAAKARLFAAPDLRHGIFNADDAYAAGMSAGARGARWWYAVDARADDATLNGRIVSGAGERLVLAVDGPWGSATLESQLVGRFNAYNLLAALAVALTGGVDIGAACAALAAVAPAPGRMQWLGGNGQPVVVIDYSHTPDSLRAALSALRPVTAGALWCVFGCGGDRDRGKRAEMGHIAERHADRVVVTDDNPRSESSAAIIEDIMAGIERAERVHIETDRARAIAHAVSGAHADDVVLLAGKGHENYQERDGERRPFSDLAAARHALDAYRRRHDA